MARGKHFLESPATPEEDSFRYRVEWDDQTTSAIDMLRNGEKLEHYGPGARDVSGFDNAWDVFNDCANSPDFIGVRLIRIGLDGSENIYASR